MHKFTDKVQKIIMNQENRFHKLCRHELYSEAMQANASDPMVIQVAKGLDNFLMKKPIILDDYDVLAGHYQYDYYFDTLPITVYGQVDPRYGADNYFDTGRETRRYYEYKGRRPDEAEKLDAFDIGVHNGLYKRWGCGHVVAGYNNVLQKGIRKIIEEIEEEKKNFSDKEKLDQLTAMQISMTALQKYIKRNAAIAEEKGLTEIADACNHIATEKPASFIEAAQLFWFAHETMMWETTTGSISCGRVDKYLYPFYKADMEAGTLTEEHAQEIVDALWLKLSTVVSAFQNIVLGGYDDNEQDGCTDLTMMCLDATYMIRADQPAIVFRYNKYTPQRFWDKCMEVIMTGIGFPALYNDDLTIKVLEEKMGLTHADAVDYAIVGCTEPTSAGKEYANTEELRFNWSKVMELVMKGKGPDGDVDLSKFTTFDEFYSWIKSEFERYLRIGIDCINMLDSVYYKNFACPFLSATMDGCKESGKDATDGGTIYNFSTVNICGSADFADSVMAVKDLVYDKKLVSLPELAKVLDANYEGYDELLAAAKASPKYGNDIKEVDAIMTEITTLFHDIVTSYTNYKGGKFQIGLYTVNDHAIMGEHTGALPCGRKAGVSLANSLAPEQGADYKGPTSLINSAVAMGHDKAANGVVLDMKFLPSFFEKENHKTAFKAMVETYFKKGGMEIQFNIVDRATLINAQKHPELYRNLVVRVSGYSAYFVTLRKSLQDEIIARTEMQGM